MLLLSASREDQLYFNESGSHAHLLLPRCVEMSRPVDPKSGQWLQMALLSRQAVRKHVSPQTTPMSPRTVPRRTLNCAAYSISFHAYGWLAGLSRNVRYAACCRRPRLLPHENGLHVYRPQGQRLRSMADIHSQSCSYVID